MHRFQSYLHNSREAASLPGGIGSGNVPAGARGKFRDREIVNWPGTGKHVLSASFASRAPGHHVPPVTRILGSELAGNGAGPYAEAPGETLVRRECRPLRGLAEVNVSWMARRS